MGSAQGSRKSKKFNMSDLEIPIVTLTENIGEDIIDFESHVKNMREHASNQDGTESQLTGFELEFRWIEKRSREADMQTDSSVAEVLENTSKNRYINVLPPNANRVVLSTISGVPSSDYVNASHIVPTFSQCPTYIAAQGPIDTTIDDFWRMIWEKDIAVVVMLTKEIESGKIKCAKYWPDSEMSVCEWMSVKQTSIEFSKDPVIREFELRNTRDPESKPKTVTHYQLREWPDHGVPSSPLGFLRLVRTVDSHPSNSPILVHCSAGIGRTGTFCVVHSTLHYLTHHAKQYSKLPPLNLIATILHFRLQRPGMVQNRDQYSFCYESILVEYMALKRQIAGKPKTASPSSST